MCKVESIKEKMKVPFLFYAFSTIFLAFMFCTYMIGSSVLSSMNFEGWVFFVVSAISHASMFMLVPFLVALPINMMGWRKTALGIQGVLVALIFVLNFINEQVYSIYKFHLNGFVFNMLTGPAAGDIFTFDTALYLKEVGLLFLVVCLAVVAYLLSRYVYAKRKKAYVLSVICTFVGCTLYAHLWNIYADFYQHRSVAKSAQLLPYFFPTTSKSLMKDVFHLTPPDGYGELDGFEESEDIVYPVNPIRVEAPNSLPNILVIMVDSWSKRCLTADNMPNTYAYAQESEWYQNHVSSSNGTRGSVFGFFFGLPSYYWNSFDKAAIRPLFIDLLLQNNYDIQTFVSAGMEDPPFARVVFGHVKGINAKSYGVNPYVNDTKATEDAISAIQKHGEEKKQHPFFYYVFLDLAHSFLGMPDDVNSVYKPAWSFADYSKLNNDMDPTPFFNLYRNCCHYDDALIGKLLATLKQQGLADNTLVILVGDHAQEFNENKKNYWGHSSNYSQWQIGVPLIVHHPSAVTSRQKVYSHRTTHYDVIPTIMYDYLGVQNPLDDYSLGHLLHDTTSREWHFVGNDLNYAFIIEGDTILEHQGNGALDVYDSKMNDVQGYKIDARQFNAAMQRVNRFYK